MTEDTMIKKMKKRKEEALEFFIEHYAGLMKSVITKTLWQYPDEWSAILNEAVFAVWDNIEAYRPEKSTFKNWCASIARYRSIDYLRRENKEKEVLKEKMAHLENSATFDINEADDLNESSVEQILKLLSPEDEAIFRAIFIDEESYESYSTKIGVSKSYLYNHISRGRKRIKKKMKGEKDYGIHESL